MFRQLDTPSSEITIFWEDRPLSAYQGELVAAVLLRHGIHSTHHGQSTGSRGPYCMMGVCFDCLVDVDNQKYEVHISYPDIDSTQDNQVSSDTNGSTDTLIGDKSIISPLEGKFYLTKNSSEKAIAVGDRVNIGDTVAYVESMKVLNAITSSEEGTVSAILVNHGDDIEEDTPLISLS